METNILDGGIFGGLPSPQDYRTLTSDMFAAAGQLPEQAKVDLSANYTNDLCDQQSLGICSKCGCRMAEESYHKDGVRLSEYWGYLIGKTLIDDVMYGQHFEGSSALTMLKAANKYGTPRKSMETQFPLLTGGTYQQFINDFRTRYGGKIPQAVLDDAATHKIPGYYSVLVNPQSIATEIAAGRLLVIRIACGENFYTKTDGTNSWNEKDILPLRAPQNVISGHLMAMNEYSGLSPDQLNKGPNSWSEQWGHRGYYSFVFNVQAPYFFTEAWAISNVPPEVINKVQDLPEAKNFKHLFLTNLQRGDTGPEVRALQIALSIKGYLNIQVDQLGTYGPKTAEAVLAYQKAKKLLPDAQLEANAGKYFYELTRHALNNDIN